MILFHWNTLRIKWKISSTILCLCYSSQLLSWLQIISWNNWSCPGRCFWRQINTCLQLQPLHLSLQPSNVLTSQVNFFTENFRTKMSMSGLKPSISSTSFGGQDISAGLGWKREHISPLKYLLLPLNSLYLLLKSLRILCQLQTLHGCQLLKQK